MDSFGVCHTVMEGLVVQEVKHVLDRQRQRIATVGCAEDGLKEIINKLLQGTLLSWKHKWQAINIQSFFSKEIILCFLCGSQQKWLELCIQKLQS